MKQVKLALIGRPNVGKSSLFNRICKKRITIVDEEEGITRDRIYRETDFFGKPFTLIDTGGIDASSDRPFNEKVIEQAELAINEADSFIMVVDSKVGVTDLDNQVAKILLKTKKPVVLAVNKVDDLSHDVLMHQFHSLGIKKIVSVSAVQGYQIAELLTEAFAGVSWPEKNGPVIKDPALPLAIVGRTNVGKSTLFNALLNDERSVVSPIAGTTRDSIDMKITCGDKEYLLIDTAGVRKKKKERFVVEKFAFLRTKEAIERADISLLVLDANKGMTTQDKKIANLIEENNKGCVLLFNKWDLVEGFRMEHCLEAVYKEVPFLKHCPVLFISAKENRNLDKIFPDVDLVKSYLTKKITTPKLNKFIEGCLQKYHPPMITGKRLRIYYLTQLNTSYPHFILFVNSPTIMTNTYKKYLINQFRENFGFSGVPVKFSVKGKRAKALALAKENS